MTMIVLRKQFFVSSALSTLLIAKWFHVEPRKTSFLKFFTTLDIFYFDSMHNFSLFVNIIILKIWKIEFLTPNFRKNGNFW